MSNVYIDNFIDRNLLTCPICWCEYNTLKYLPFCLSCGHTVCVECIKKLREKNELKCPIDKTKISLLDDKVLFKKKKYSNNSIINIVEFLQNIYFNCKILAKLEFFYCNSCDLLISNSVRNVHRLSHHKTTSFNRAKYFLIENWYNEIVNIQKMEKEKLAKLNLFVILLYFHNPKILITYSTINDSDVRKNEFLFEKNFSFSGCKLDINVEIIKKSNDLVYLTQFVLVENKCSVLKKGIYYSKNKELIHGIFSFDSNNLINKALGLYRNKKNELFFGISSFTYNIKLNLYKIQFNYGILFKNQSFHFGQFTGMDVVYGEEIQYDLSNSVRKNFNSNSGYFENLFNNSFFSISDNILLFSNNIVNTSNNNHNLSYNVEYIITNSIYLEKLLIIRDSKIEYKIIPLNENKKLIDLSVEDCFIQFIKNPTEILTIKFVKNKLFSFILNHKIVRNNYSNYLYQLKTKFLDDIPYLQELIEMKSLFIIHVQIKFEIFIKKFINFLFESPNYYDIYYGDLKNDYTEKDDFLIDYENREVPIEVNRIESFKTTDFIKNLKKYDLISDIDSSVYFKPQDTNDLLSHGIKYNTDNSNVRTKFCDPKEKNTSFYSINKLKCNCSIY